MHVKLKLKEQMIQHYQNTFNPKPTFYTRPLPKFIDSKYFNDSTRHLLTKKEEIINKASEELQEKEVMKVSDNLTPDMKVEKEWKRLNDRINRKNKLSRLIDQLRVTMKKPTASYNDTQPMYSSFSPNKIFNDPLDKVVKTEVIEDTQDTSKTVFKTIEEKSKRGLPNTSSSPLKINVITGAFTNFYWFIRRNYKFFMNFSILFPITGGLGALCASLLYFSENHSFSFGPPYCLYIISECFIGIKVSLTECKKIAGTFTFSNPSIGFNSSISKSYTNLRFSFANA